MAGRWVDVGEASRELGISTDAVRKRITRGSLRSERRDGSVRVWLDDSGQETGHEARVEHAEGSNELIEELREQVHYLRSILNEEREARRRADTIIAQLTQANATLATRLPELEAPATEPAPSQEPPGRRSESAKDVPTPPPSSPGAKEGSGDRGARPLWRRLLRERLRPYIW